MKSMRLKGLCFIFCVVLLVIGNQALTAAPPSAVYLTWTEDPTSTMVIRWLTPKAEESRLFYRGVGAAEWQKAEGTSERLPVKGGAQVHTVHLKGLSAATVYQFRLAQDPQEYKFRTCSSEQNLRFAVGGDAYYFLRTFRKMNQQIARKDPDFVVVGGDLAYVYKHHTPLKGKGWENRRWGTFFKEWMKEMVTSDGRLIPILVAVGNHDISTPDGAAFHTLFSFSEALSLLHEGSHGGSYGILDFGSYFSLALLDTGHLNPVEGAQTQWLEKVLQARQDVPYKVAVYHVAAYPSIYPYGGEVPTNMRKNWVPLFEKYGLQVAFENHNHAYKRTYPLKEGKIDPQGVLYLGDGAWGVLPRKVRYPAQNWYVEKFGSVDHFWLVTLTPEKCQIQSFNIKGQLIEEVPLKPSVVVGSSP